MAEEEGDAPPGPAGGAPRSPGAAAGEGGAAAAAAAARKYNSLSASLGYTTYSLEDRDFLAASNPGGGQRPAGWGLGGASSSSWTACGPGPDAGGGAAGPPMSPFGSRAVRIAGRVAHSVVVTAHAAAAAVGGGQGGGGGGEAQ
jgi:hypothetical protein